MSIATQRAAINQARQQDPTNIRLLLSLVHLDLVDLDGLVGRCSDDLSAEVVHLPQQHWLKDFEQFGDAQKAAAIELVAGVQFKVAVYLLANLDAAVFLEGLTQDLTGANLGFEWLTAKRLFPQGLPRTLGEFTTEQKAYLARKGAVKVLYYLRYLKDVHKVLAPEESRLIDDQVRIQFEQGNRSVFSQELYPLIVTQRQQAAAREINTFISVNRDTKVVLVFGGGHDFTEYFQGVRFFRAECT